MARALKFAWGCGRPWLLLLPDFVSRKSYFKQLSQSASVDCPHLPWFLGPRHSMCHALSFVLFLHLHLMRIRYTFAAPRTAHTGSHLVDANVRHVSSQGASVFAAPFQCVWFMQLGTAGRAPLFHAAASWHPRDTRLRQGHQGTHGPASSAAAFLRCCGLHRAGGQLKFNQQSSVPPLHLRSCVLLQLPQLVKPAAKPHRPWRKKAQRERKRMRNDK